MKSGEEKLQALKAIFTDSVQKVAIFTGIPDPDSIGAALGMKLLIDRLCGAACDIIYSGEVSHPQNKTLINILNIQMLRQQEVLAVNDKPLVSRYDKIVFVDCVPREKWTQELPIAVVIDHHKANYENADFVDIRQVGACCSMVANYLQAANIDLASNMNEEELSKVATAMLFGVKTDTHDLMSENVTNVDFEAYQYLVRYVDRDDLVPIINYQLPAYYFEIRRRLEKEENRQIQGAFFVGGVGFLSAARRDSLPMLADERVRMEGITTAIIFALVEDCLEASVRSNNAAIDVNSFCQNIFGKEFAGGKHGAGAAKIPLGVLAVDSLTEDIKEESWNIYRQIIMTKIIRVCESK